MDAKESIQLGRPLADLDTPSLLLDRAAVLRNGRRAVRALEGTGVELRPHLKIAKSARVAALAHGADERPGAYAVSTIREARELAAEGLADLLLAVTLPPQRIPAAIDLVRRGVRLRVATDDAGVVEALIEASTASGVELEVLLELDCGHHRGGLPLEVRQVEVLARRLHEAPGVVFGGLMTYAGHVYGARDREELFAIARQERRDLRTTAERLETAGIPCAVRSAGGSQTLGCPDELDGVTELRAGTYLFGDARSVALGTIDPEDVALTVLATVIGHSPATGRLVIDAGALALPGGASANLDLPQPCHGLLYDESGCERLDDLHVAAISQEHGLVASATPIDFHTFPVGRRVRVMPVTANLTSCAFDRFHVVDERGAVVADWERITGW